MRIGNRLTDIQQNSYTYNNGNELLNYDGITFTYDLNGNMVSKTDSNGTTSYVYDSENRLVQINTQPGNQMGSNLQKSFDKIIKISIIATNGKAIEDRV